jgi:hypothetical protein
MIRALLACLVAAALALPGHARGVDPKNRRSTSRYTFLRVPTPGTTPATYFVPFWVPAGTRVVDVIATQQDKGTGTGTFGWVCTLIGEYAAFGAPGEPYYNPVSSIGFTNSATAGNNVSVNLASSPLGVLPLPTGASRGSQRMAPTFALARLNFQVPAGYGDTATITMGSTTWTAINAAATPTSHLQFRKGATAAETADNFVAALASTPESEFVFKRYVSSTQVEVALRWPGSVRMLPGTNVVTHANGNIVSHDPADGSLDPPKDVLTRGGQNNVAIFFTGTWTSAPTGMCTVVFEPAY